MAVGAAVGTVAVAVFGRPPPSTRPSDTNVTSSAPEAVSGIAQPASGPGRIYVLDPLRGLAACAVMWFHFTKGGPLLRGAEGASAWLKASGAKGWLGVEVFFVISGFVLPYAMWRGRYRLRDYGTFLVKRLLRLEPPYFCAILLTVGLWLAGPLIPGFSGDPFRFDGRQFALHFGYLNAFVGYPWYNPVFWTLAIEFQFYLLIALLFPLAVHPSLAVRVALPLALAGLAFLPVSDSLVFHHLPLFALGIATAQHYIGLLPRRAFVALLVVLAAAALATLGGYPAGVGIAAAVLIAVLARTDPAGRIGRALRLRPLVWLGAVSYSVYLLHVPIGGRVVNLGSRFAEGFWMQVLVLAAAAVASLAAAYAMYRLVEQPSQRWSSGIRYRSAKPEPTRSSPPPRVLEREAP